MNTPPAAATTNYCTHTNLPTTLQYCTVHTTVPLTTGTLGTVQMAQAPIPTKHGKATRRNLVAACDARWGGLATGQYDSSKCYGMVQYHGVKYSLQHLTAP